MHACISTGKISITHMRAPEAGWRPGRGTRGRGRPVLGRKPHHGCRRLGRRAGRRSPQGACSFTFSRSWTRRAPSVFQRRKWFSRGVRLLRGARAAGGRARRDATAAALTWSILATSGATRPMASSLPSRSVLAPVWGAPCLPAGAPALRPRHLPPVWPVPPPGGRQEGREVPPRCCSALDSSPWRCPGRPGALRWPFLPRDLLCGARYLPVHATALSTGVQISAASKGSAARPPPHRLHKPSFRAHHPFVSRFLAGWAAWRWTPRRSSPRS